MDHLHSPAVLLLCNKPQRDTSFAFVIVLDISRLVTSRQSSVWMRLFRPSSISHRMNVAFCLQLGARVTLKSVLMTRWSALSLVEWTDWWKNLRTARSPVRSPLPAALITLHYVNAGSDASLMSCVGRRADVLMHANRSKRTRQQALIPFWRQYLISGAWLFQRWSSLNGC